MEVDETNGNVVDMHHQAYLYEDDSSESHKHMAQYLGMVEHSHSESGSRYMLQNQRANVGEINEVGLYLDNYNRIPGYSTNPPGSAST